MNGHNDVAFMDKNPKMLVEEDGQNDVACMDKTMIDCNEAAQLVEPKNVNTCIVFRYGM